MMGVDLLTPAFEKAVVAAAQEESPDNPIYRVVRDSIMKKEALKEGTDPYLITMIEELTSKVERLRGQRESTVSSFQLPFVSTDSNSDDIPPDALCIRITVNSTTHTLERVMAVMGEYQGIRYAGLGKIPSDENVYFVFFTAKNGIHDAREVLQILRGMGYNCSIKK